MAAAISLAFVVVMACVGAVAWAAPPEGAPEKAEKTEEKAAPVVVAPDSPRASIARFLELCATGDYAHAAQYMDLPPAQREQGPELARRLKAVLDRYVGLELESLSPLATGQTNDGLPPNTDEIGQIGVEGEKEPITIVRRYDGAGRWVFSRSTVMRVDAWYGRLENRWLIERLPAPLLRAGPRGLLWWQWIAIPTLIAGVLTVATALARLTRTVLTRLAARTANSVDDALAARLRGPLILAWGAILFGPTVPWLALRPAAEDVARRLAGTALLIAFFWALARLADVAAQVTAQSNWALTHRAARSLIPLAVKVAKVAVVALAVVAVLAQLGYPVASLIAGLGIGGLAVALAAQKSLENLFGAFAIGADQPFREGDFVRIEDTVGTVESIGLRSTKIRTLDRTLVTYPNGKLADMRLESFTARDRMRLTCVFRLVYGTTADQMREVLTGFERVLRAHPKIWPDSVNVHFKELGRWSLDVEVMVWFQTPDWNEFQTIRDGVLLDLMKVIEDAGTSLAVPTRTLHMEPSRDLGRA